jgi:hypothetical protein
VITAPPKPRQVAGALVPIAALGIGLYVVTRDGLDVQGLDGA